ncbi:MAG: response regulator [Verrucomicrobia bacterium]|nr:response regulator [Verrucomicrobiota bacterium]
MSGETVFWLWVGGTVGTVLMLGVMLAIVFRRPGGRAFAQLGYALWPEKTWRRLLMELSSDAMLLVDRSGRVLEANQSLCDLGGWTQAELLDRPLVSLVGESDRRAVAEALARLPGARSLTGQVVLRNKQEELMRTEWRWVPVSKGEFYIFIRDLRAPTRFEATPDVAEEMTALNRVSTSVSQLLDLQSVLDHAIEETMRVVGADVGAITMLDAGGGKLALAVQRGLPAERLRNAVESVPLEGQELAQQLFKTRSILYHKSLNRAPLPSALAQLLQEQQVHAMISIPIVSKGRALGQMDLGVQRPNQFQTVNTAVLSAIGEQIGMAIQNARLMQEVNEKAVHLQYVLDSSPAGILVVSTLPQGEMVTLVNSRFGEMFGVASGTLANRPLEEVRPLLFNCCADPQEFKHRFARLMAAPTTEDRGELALQRPKPLVLDYFTAPVHDDYKRVIGRIWVFTDITQQKAMSEGLQQMQKLESVGTLASGIAHDFRNLLNTIMGNLTLARDNLNDAGEAAHRLTNAEAAAQSAAAVCESLLAFGRKAPAKLVPVRLRSTLEEVGRMLHSSLPSNIQLIIDVAPDLRAVEADTTQILQVVMNLAINARDAMPKGGRLIIRARNRDLDEAACAGHPEARPGSFVLIEVEDTGTGIPPAVMARIFEPFFTTKAPDKGTGLGLAMVYGVAKAHRSWVQVQSQLHVGTVFQFFLPVTDKPAQPTEPVFKPRIPAPGSQPRPAATPPMTSQTPAPAASETILVTDDDEMVLELTKTFLEKAGYKTLVANGGLQALDQLRAHPGPVSLAILDLHMPGMSGEECLRELKKLRPDLKAIFLTGYDLETASESAAKAGAAGVLTKPILRNALLAEVRRFLDAPAPAA